MACMNSVSRNATFLTGALVIQKALSFGLFSFLARPANYGAGGVGRYSYALAFTTIFAIFIDGGLTPVVIREVAKNPGVSGNLLHKVLKIKFLLLALTLIGIYLVAQFNGAAREVLPLIGIAAVVMAFDSLNLTLYGVLRGLHTLIPESLGIIFGQVVVLSFGIFSILGRLPLAVVMWGLCAGSFLNSLIAYYSLRKKLQFTELSPTVKQLAKESSAFFLAGIFARGYSFFDSILLGSLAGFVITGIYSVANKLTFAFQFIPLALTGALFPAFSALVAQNDHGAAQALWLKTERYLVVVGVFITAALIGLRVPILSFYGADYVSGQYVLVVLALSLVFSFASYPTGALLNGSGLQHLQTTAMGATLLLNVLGNVLLVPRLGAMGAAISALLGNLLLFIGGVFFAHRRTLSLPLKKFLFFLIPVGTLAGASAWGMWYLSTLIPWFLVGILGGLFYLLLLLITGLISRTEIQALFKTAGQRV